MSFAEILTSFSLENDHFPTENDPFYYESIQDPPPILGDFHYAAAPSAHYKKSLYFTRSATKPKMSSIKPHAFSSIEINALEKMNRHLKPSYELSMHFTVQELKSAFRHGVKSLHPDHGGSAELFSDFFLSYKILLDFFKTIK